MIFEFQITTMKNHILIITLSFLSLSSYGQFDDPVAELIDNGIALSEEGKIEESIIQFTKAIKLDKKNNWPYFERASVYFKQKEYDKCLKDLNRILKNRDGSYQIDAYLMKADALEWKGEKLEALEVYEEAIKRYTNSSVLHFKIGVRYMKIGEDDLAQKYLEHSIYLNDKNANTHKALANVLLKKGLNGRAYLVIIRALMLDPKLKDGVNLASTLHQDIEKRLSSEEDTLFKYDIPDGQETFLSKTGKLDDLVKKFDVFINSIELKSDEYKDNFYWKYYVKFYKALIRENHSKLMIYEMLQDVSLSEYGPMKINEQYLIEKKKFLQWVDTYEWPKLYR